MTIQPVEYVRKSFSVEGLQVTNENMSEVAEWCKGTVMFDDEGRNTYSGYYIKVDVSRALNERQSRAYPTDWVLRSGNGFKVYTTKAFDNSFEPQHVTPVITVS